MPVEVSYFSLSFILINVYGLTSVVSKKNLWNSLSRVIENLGPIKNIMAGDFNATLGAQDKVGGMDPSPKVTQNFKDFLEGNAFFDCIPVNGIITWSNRRKGIRNVGVRLDRFLLNP